MFDKKTAPGAGQHMLEHIMSSDKDLRTMTCLSRAEFGHILGLVSACAKRRPDCAVLYRDGGGGPADAGGQFVPYMRHALLLAMMYKATNLQLDVVGMMYGMFEDNGYREIGVMNEAMEEVLPTAGNISANIRRAKTRAEVMEAMPGGAVIVYGTHTLVEGQELDLERALRGELHDAGPDTPTYNTTMMGNLNGVIVAMGETHLGSRRDLETLRDGPLGRMTGDAYDIDNAAGERIDVFAGPRYHNMARGLPGANPQRLHKHTVGNITRAQRRRNRLADGITRCTNHAVGEIEEYGVARGPWPEARGAEGLNRELNLVTGLLNFRAIWPKIRAKTGPQYARPAGAGA